MGGMFIGAPGTSAPGGIGALTPYAMCGEGPARFTGVPTAETRGPPIGCPILGAPYMPTPGGPAADCLADFPEPDEPTAGPFD